MANIFYHKLSMVWLSIKFEAWWIKALQILHLQADQSGPSVNST